MYDKSESQPPPDSSVKARIREVLVRQLMAEELSRASEIDVSESGDIVSKCTGGRIHPEKEGWTRPRWDVDDWRSNIESQLGSRYRE